MRANTTLGVVVANRAFFPDHLVEKGRKQILRALTDEGLEAVVLSPEETKFGSVETREDAGKCAALFRRHADDIDGILVTLPNFGDEGPIADAIRQAGLDVPVLVHAFPDRLDRLDVANRGDAFCGKLSVCNNLRQYGIRYSLTRSHTVSPDADEFREDLQWFAAVCRIVRGLRTARIGAIGARPGPFKTVRFSETLLEASGISVEVIDLSEIFASVHALADDDSRVQQKLTQLRDYIDVSAVPDASLLRMARLAAVIEGWMAEQDLDATAMQCWLSMQENLGICCCGVMGMMSEALKPSACEMDVTGAVAMYALSLASGKPSALLDWNNNYGDDADKCVAFHCSNLPASMMRDARMTRQDILAEICGPENTYGTCSGRIKPGPFTFARVSTDDREGRIRAYVGEGEWTDDPLDSFGGVGVARIRGLQHLMRYVCQRGFEHHVAVNHSLVASALEEAFGRYLGWECHRHEAE
ncbi:MAG: L-fucose/L-arabinose isomerase family protein [Armatimonadota bacterium]